MVDRRAGGAVGPTTFNGDAASAARRRDWEAGVTALAALPNVCMKVGGLHMPVNGFALGPEHRPRPATSLQIAELT